MASKFIKKVQVREWDCLAKKGDCSRTGGEGREAAVVVVGIERMVGARSVSMGATTGLEFASCDLCGSLGKAGAPCLSPGLDVLEGAFELGLLWP